MMLWQYRYKKIFERYYPFPVFLRNPTFKGYLWFKKKADITTVIYQYLVTFLSNEIENRFILCKSNSPSGNFDILTFYALSNLFKKLLVIVNNLPWRCYMSLQQLYLGYLEFLFPAVSNRRRVFEFLPSNCLGMPDYHNYCGSDSESRCLCSKPFKFLNESKYTVGSNNVDVNVWEVWKTRLSTRQIVLWVNFTYLTCCGLIRTMEVYCVEVFWLGPYFLFVFSFMCYVFILFLY